MNVILISNSQPIEKETQIITECFNRGLLLFHLRKPFWDEDEMRSCIMDIPKEYHNRIVLHSNYKLMDEFNLKGIHITSKERVNIDDLFNRYPVASTGCHSIEEVKNMFGYGFKYLFLSPLFDSISKESYRSEFKITDLAGQIDSIDIPIFALGGITPEKRKICTDAGFAGLAFLGWFWQKNNGDFKDKIKILISL